MRPYLYPFIQKTEIKRLVGEIQRYKSNQQLKKNLSQAMARMKLYADKNRIERSSEKDGCVFLKLHPYTQKSVECRANYRISERYIDPYPIVKKVGAVAYQLALQEGKKIHPKFCASLLKKKLGNDNMPMLQLPSDSQPAQHERYLLNILQSRLVNRRTHIGSHSVIGLFLRHVLDARRK
ncbi:uncharacterized protein LOC111370012 [Olea europaea var. sylvestris]|uniref:uncharacterized protein LOC111370012 n=1 Tax=Olea europaea var. sylvestris TaxID=158386 RepID=UPI000C1D054C|nr:uncharacterized protein LOC111370012 [Olea europaea var. sylvestris]